METEGMMVYFLRRVMIEVSDIVIGRQTGNVLPAFGVLRTLILPLCNPAIPFSNSHFYFSPRQFLQSSIQVHMGELNNVGNVINEKTEFGVHFTMATASISTLPPLGRAAT
jgi:hypothetical protein